MRRRARASERRGRKGVRDASAAVSAGALLEMSRGRSVPNAVVVSSPSLAIRAASLRSLVQARSTAAVWAHERSFASLWTGEEPLGRRATLSVDGGLHPGGAASHPRPQTHGDAPLVGGSGWRIGIFSGDVKRAVDARLEHCNRPTSRETPETSAHIFCTLEPIENARPLRKRESLD
jgi:hypothetical protein